MMPPPNVTGQLHMGHAVLGLPFAVAGCKKDSKLIKINEVTHSVFYAPLYLADALGYFKDEGYEIQLKR